MARDYDAKAVAKEDATGNLTTSNYFGGEGTSDGPGHGHVDVNEQGDVTYARESDEYGGGDGTESK